MSFGVYRSDYQTEDQYHKAVKKYRDMGYVIITVCGGVRCFETMREYNLWRTQT